MISIIITLVGYISFLALPITEYPQIAPPTVVVNASYAGASAEVVAQTVAAPIEQEINGVDNMLYVVSQSTGNGAVSINVVFKTGTNIDQAQVLVQNRVAVALPRLPQEVQRVGVTVRKSSPDLLLVVHLVSPDGSLDQQYISNYATINVKDVITRLDGVGDIIVFGARDYSMRVWLDPALIQARGLTASDVVTALRGANIQVAGGRDQSATGQIAGRIRACGADARAAVEPGAVQRHRGRHRQRRARDARARHRPCRARLAQTTRPTLISTIRWPLQ